MIKIAHRGAHSIYPENSLSAIEQAIKDNTDAIEIDVRVCNTGELIVSHDSNLKRMTGQNLKIEKSDFRDIKSLRFLTKENEAIPTLDDVLDLVFGKVRINIEFKAINYKMLASVQKLSKKFKRLNHSEDVWISSFNPLLLNKLQSVLDLKTAFLFDRVKYIPLVFTEMFNIDFWHPNYSLVDEKLMEVAEQRGKKVIPWTVNDKIEVERLRKLNVYGIITDDINLLN